MRANLAAFTNALCHRNATPLSVAVLAPCVWGGNVACGVAWQDTLNSAKYNTAWCGEFGNETAQHSKFNGKASATNSVWQAFVGKTKRGDIANLARRKWGSVWAGDFSLSLSLSR